MDIIQKIKDHLSKSTRNFITVQNGTKRLKKDAFHNKFLWSEKDVEENFGSVEELLKQLPSHGFGSESLLLLRTKYSNNNYIDKGQFTLKLKDEALVKPIEKEKNVQMTSHDQIQKQDQSHQPNNPAHISTPPSVQPQYGLGFTPVATNEWTDLKVKEQRYFDIETKNRELLTELQDAKSENRILKEDNASLNRKLDTIEDRHSLALEREALGKKSFLDSESGQKAIEALGAALPMLLERKAVAAPMLGNPHASLSQTKQQFIQMISQDQVSDEQIIMLYHIMQYSSSMDGFQEELQVLIQKAQEYGNDTNH